MCGGVALKRQSATEGAEEEKREWGKEGGLADDDLGMKHAWSYLVHQGISRYLKVSSSTTLAWRFNLIIKRCNLIKRSWTRSLDIQPAGA
jgi:hypothetical protein